MGFIAPWNYYCLMFFRWKVINAYQITMWCFVKQLYVLCIYNIYIYIYMEIFLVADFIVWIVIFK